MDGCNATLNNLACNRHSGGPESSHPAPHRHHNSSGRLVLAWGDEVPGATPQHRDLRFQAVPDSPGGSGWVVLRDQTPYTIARFTSHHPNPKDAAEAEAARLNGEDGWRFLDKDKIEDYVKVIRLRLERDAFRAALEKIANVPLSSPACREVARKALEGGR